MKQHYIFHTGDRDNPEDKGAYFGPFPEEEITERINDAYADCLAQIADIMAVTLTDEIADEFYINPPEFWYEQLKEIENA